MLSTILQKSGNETPSTVSSSEDSFKLIFVYSGRSQFHKDVCSYLALCGTCFHLLQKAWSQMNCFWLMNMSKSMLERFLTWSLFSVFLVFPILSVCLFFHIIFHPFNSYLYLPLLSWNHNGFILFYFICTLWVSCSITFYLFSH